MTIRLATGESGERRIRNRKDRIKDRFRVSGSGFVVYGLWFKIDVAGLRLLSQDNKRTLEP